MSYTVTPDKANATYESFAGLAMNDPVNYSAAPTLPDPTVTAQYHYVPWQNEILNLIDKSLSGGDAFRIRNETGGVLAVGTLVSITGYNSSEDRFLITAADCDDNSLPAHGVLIAALNDNTNGIAYKSADISGLNTAAASVGDEVYLSNTAGDFLLTAPTGVAQYAQVVGFVHTSHASTGVIRYRIGMPSEMERISEAHLPSSVPTLGAMTDNALVRIDTDADLQDSGVILDDSNNMTGVETITVNNAGTFNNDQDATGDFLVKGQSISHAFFVDVSTGRSHVGYNTTPTGTAALNVLGTLQITDSGTNYDTLAVNFSDGTPRATLGTHESLTDYGIIHLGNITPNTTNYALRSDGSSTTLNTTSSLSLTINGSSYCSFSTAAMTVNPLNFNCDFRVDGDTNDEVFVVDAGDEHVRVKPKAADYDAFRVLHSDGTPRVTMGTYEAVTTYGVIHMANITPSNLNYTLAGLTTDTILNSTSSTRLSVSNGEKLRVSSTEVVINETSITADFRIEGTSLSHGFFYDASTARIHAGLNTTPTGTHNMNMWPDTDASFAFGRSVLGNSNFSDFAGFGHFDQVSSVGYSILHSASGQTFINTTSGGYIAFRRNNVDKMRMDDSGNFLIGTTTSPTGTMGKVLMFGDNAGDPTPGTNTAGIYGKDVSGTVEMFAVDEAANVTQLSPHDEHGNWWFKSTNKKTGRELRVHLEKFFKKFVAEHPEYAEFLEETLLQG